MVISDLLGLVHNVFTGELVGLRTRREERPMFQFGLVQKNGGKMNTHRYMI